MPLMRSAITGVLRPVIKSTAGARVRYTSKVSGESYTVIATLDASAADAETQEGIQFTEMVKDFKIDVADLPVYPQDGDEIYVKNAFGVKEQYYMVLGTGGARSTEPLGNFEDTWRIHAKNIPRPEPVQAIYGNSSGNSYGNAAGDDYASSRR